MLRLAPDYLFAAFVLVIELQRKILAVDVHLHNNWADMYLLFIMYFVAKDTSRSMKREGAEKVFHNL